MWEIYDLLLSGMDESEVLDELLIGPRWAVVRSESGSIGIAPVIMERSDRFDFSFQPEKGMPLKEIASYIRSWNFMESSLALAAVNASYNHSGKKDGADDLSVVSEERRILPGGRRTRQAFRIFCKEYASAGTTVLAEPVYDSDEFTDVSGHMEVLRKDTQFRDYYYTAYRERIPEADRLVLSGRTLVDKTAGPMMELAVRHEKDIFLFGPDVPLCSALIGYGIRGIWGFEVDKAEELMKIARINMQKDQFLRLGHFAVLDAQGRIV